MCKTAKNTYNKDLNDIFMVASLMKVKSIAECSPWSISLTKAEIIDYTVKPVLNGHSKLDKTKILMTILW